MSFESPGYLSLLAVALAGVGALLWLERWRNAALRRFAPGAPFARLRPALRPGLRLAGVGLFAFGLAAIAVALARPQAGERERTVEQSGADVMLVLDVSRSMLTGDQQPNRLDRAQGAARQVVDGLHGDRVGLVIFAGGSLLRAPLTADSAPLHAMIDSARIDSTLLVPGSDVGGGLRAALRALEAGEAEAQAIVLLSDGEDHEGQAIAAARDAARQGAVVHVAGFGTDVGSLVPVIDAETGAVVSGEQAGAETAVISRLDESVLRGVAGAGRGEYRAGNVDGFADSINRMERTRFAVQREDQPVELFQFAVLAALALLAAEFALPERAVRLPFVRRIPSGAAVAPALLLLVVLASGCGGENAAGLVDDGNRAYSRGDYDAALDFYRRAEAEAPERPEAHINAGLALHRLGQFERAAEATRRALPADDPLLGSRIHYNLAGHWFELGRLQEALSEYREALILNPGDRDAKHNLELTQRLLREQANRAPQPSEGESSDDDGQPAQGSGGAPGESGAAGEPGAGSQAEQSLAQALAGIDDSFTIDEALRVLDAVRELNQEPPLVRPEETPETSDRPDY